MMRSVGAVMVLVLMVLRTAAQTETTSPPLPTTPQCPDLSWCQGMCFVDYSDPTNGCPTCICGDPICSLVDCGPDADCVQNNEAPHGYDCVPRYGTTTETISGWPTPLLCPDLSWCTGSCYPDYSSPTDGGCPTCLCVDPICGWLVQCGPDEECVLSSDAPLGAVCVPKYDTATTSSTYPTTTTYACPLPPCARGCRIVRVPGGCFGCSCPDTTCEETTCEPGQVCVMQNLDCLEDYSSCFLWPTCVTSTDTATTSSTYPTTTTYACPLPPCARGCRIVRVPGGCFGCSCPDTTCEETTCEPGQVCVMQNLDCLEDYSSCFLWPTCVTLTGTTTESSVSPAEPITDPCTGTPNTNQCADSSILRWTYNSVTDKCEIFNYYDCIPSPNTFSSRKACKNNCNGRRICPTVVCGNNCYVSTKKNDCSKCICPCKGFECPKGYECKLQEANSLNQEPEPFCDIKPCPTQTDPCNMKCKYGLKTDKNGCQLCECLKKPPAET